LCLRFIPAAFYLLTLWSCCFGFIGNSSPAIYSVF
jgi:hypothetical protein